MVFVDISFFLFEVIVLWTKVVWTEDRTVGSVSTCISGHLDPVSLGDNALWKAAG